MPGCSLEMLGDLTLTIGPRVHASLLRICVSWIVRFLVPPFILIFFFFFKKKKIFCLSCSLLKQIGSYYVAVSRRLFCSGLVVGGNQWKETWGTKPPELYWVTFDSLKRSQSSLLSGVSRGLCQVMSEIQMLCKSPTSFHLCSHAKCFLRKGRLSAFAHALPL